MKVLNFNVVSQKTKTGWQPTFINYALTNLSFKSKKECDKFIEQKPYEIIVGLILVIKYIQKKYEEDNKNNNNNNNDK